jgi:hypothetical protein
MSRWEAWSFGALNLVLALTGGVYFYMKFVLRTDDPFAVVNHPWQSFRRWAWCSSGSSSARTS